MRRTGTLQRPAADDLIAGRPADRWVMPDVTAMPGGQLIARMESVTVRGQKNAMWTDTLLILEHESGPMAAVLISQLYAATFNSCTKDHGRFLMMGLT